MTKAERMQTSRVSDTQEAVPARHIVRVAASACADLVVLSLDAPPDGSGRCRLRQQVMSLVRFKLEVYLAGIRVEVDVFNLPASPSHFKEKIALDEIPFAAAFVHNDFPHCLKEVFETTKLSRLVYILKRNAGGS